MKPEKYSMGEYIQNRVIKITDALGSLGMVCSSWVRSKILRHWWCWSCHKYHSHRVKQYSKLKFMSWVDVCSLGMVEGNKTNQ